MHTLTAGSWSPNHSARKPRCGKRFCSGRSHAQLTAAHWARMMSLSHRQVGRLVDLERAGAPRRCGRKLGGWCSSDEEQQPWAAAAFLGLSQVRFSAPARERSGESLQTPKCQTHAVPFGKGMVIQAHPDESEGWAAPIRCYWKRRGWALLERGLIWWHFPVVWCQRTFPG